MRILDRLSDIFRRRKRDKRFHSRRYYALREAQALRLQFNADAERFCSQKLAHPATTGRDRRFYRLVQRELRRV